MIAELLRHRIADYRPADALEQENVLQELMQHYVLRTLADTGFFSDAMFHGGTCLRILFGMPRFSEDLDFLLKDPNPQFCWQPYLDRIVRDSALEGLDVQVVDRNAADSAVRKAFVKTASIGSILLLNLPFDRDSRRHIRIKLEIDTNPPAGSSFETRFITFPATRPVTVQTLQSGFATKSHALLCRNYLKGRDWYDLLWYIGRSVSPDLELLRNALTQQGPWAGQDIEVTAQWYLDTMHERIDQVDWRQARADVERFLNAGERERAQIVLWSAELFHDQIDQMARYLMT